MNDQRPLAWSTDELAHFAPTEEMAATERTDPAHATSPTEGDHTP
ncbi:hypothetical protein [Rudaeicoccus suwonensis]|uniref:Uncharacterized protein n=1 Tax=Rudaeicoccus suwonensis TaxID=657409 RepID=A0A561EAP8_9MICO|nr:hypothetical protein [Rudaeicoccus suwonensis]TWE12679.1 hypothetical protein BKA23_1495 [Rudaeicoccus suwonensis]